MAEYLDTVQHAPNNTIFVRLCSEDRSRRNLVPLGTLMRLARGQACDPAILGPLGDFMEMHRWIERTSRGTRSLVRLTPLGVLMVRVLEHEAVTGMRLSVRYRALVAGEGLVGQWFSEAGLYDDRGNPGKKLRRLLEVSAFRNGYAETLDGIDGIKLSYHGAIVRLTQDNLHDLSQGSAYLPDVAQRKKTFAALVEYGYVNREGFATRGGKRRAAAWLRELDRTKEREDEQERFTALLDEIDRIKENNRG